MKRMGVWVASLLALVVFVGAVGAQTTPTAETVKPPEDPLGRGTPRGTVLGFLSAARKGDDALAREYLHTRLTGRAADTLAHQLFVVLDARLPARLTQLSDAPEGSRTNPLTPDRERVGTIESTQGPIDVFLDRLTRNGSPPIWLFASATLDDVPALYDDVTTRRREGPLSRFLVETRADTMQVAQWLIVLLGVAVLYAGTLLLDRLLTPIVDVLRRLLTGRAAVVSRSAVPTPVRLLVVAIAVRWLLSDLPLSLLVRQFWISAASLIAMTAIVWLGLLGTGELERVIHHRVPQSNVSAASSLLRVARRAADLLIIFVGLLATLRHFGIDPTPALAGLGVGGIAVALAAQKTLENVIAGASLIFDQAVRVGDFLKMGDIMGTVDHIGLRSTRLRTLDRTVVSVPNGQIANASLETLSARDKFWFHPIVPLRYETTPEQLHAVVDGLRRLLYQHPQIDPASVRVRFIRLGSFSFDVEVFAYVAARDWNHFLELQEMLLFNVTELVVKAGTAIALPSQTTYVARNSLPAPDGD
jgi:MscS family membrane protein